MKTFFLLFLFCSLLPAQHVFLDQIYNSDTGASIKVTSPFSGVAPRGYQPVTIEIKNTAASPVRWNITAKSNDGYLYNWDKSNRMSSQYTITCPPGEVVKRSLLIPLVSVLDYTRYQNTANLSLSLINNEAESFHPDLETNLHKDIPAILMSERIHRQNGSSFSSEFIKSIAKSSGKKLDFNTHFLPQDLPTDWRAFTGFDVIMITLADWGEADASAHRTLLEWVKMGGELLVYDVAGKEADLKSVGIPEAGPHGWGNISGKEMDATMKISPKTFLADVKKAPKANQKLIKGYQGKDWHLKNALGNKGGNIALLLIILLIFAIFVGPLNLFVFAREGRRHRLFFTTPLISLITTLTLLTVILLKDGIGGRGFTQSLIEVDHAGHTLYGAQEQLCRTGMLLKTNFNLDTPAVIDPALLSKNNYWARLRAGHKGGKCHYKTQIESPSKTRLAGDWYLSRTESAHIIHYKKPTRQGVEFTQKNDGLYALCSFPSTLQAIYYISENGEVFIGKNLQQGKETKLEPSTKNTFMQWVKTHAPQFGEDNRLRLKSLMNQKGRYFAQADEWEHLETLSQIKWEQKKAILTGKVPDPSPR